MSIARNGDIELHYEVHGDLGQGIPLLLVHGLGMQLVQWADALLADLVGRGYAIVVYDNRDIGLSTHLTQFTPDVLAALSGKAEPPYRIPELAADAVAVLDAVGLRSAHVLGVSMGGMIAQQLAIDHPDRVRSLTSIMSSTGDPQVGQAHPHVLPLLLAAPPPDRAGAVAAAMEVWAAIGSPDYGHDEDAQRLAAGLSYDRAFDPMGVGRQLVAILSSADRTEALRGLSLPTLVVHGAADPLVDPTGGRATAAAVPGAKLLVIDGMGHDLPPAVLPRVVDAVAELVAKAEATAGIR